LGYCGVVMNEERKTGRGRPKGATSFTRIQLQDLINHLGPSASVVVGKKWLEEVGMTLDQPAKPTKVVPVKAPAKEESEEPIQFSLTSFD